MNVNGQMAERLKAADCKSVLVRVRRFEPYSAHQSISRCAGLLLLVLVNGSVSLKNVHFSWLANCLSGSSSFGRAIAFQAIGGEFEPRLPLLDPACNGGYRNKLL